MKRAFRKIENELTKERLKPVIGLSQKINRGLFIFKSGNVAAIEWKKSSWKEWFSGFGILRAFSQDLRNTYKNLTDDFESYCEKQYVILLKNGIIDQNASLALVSRSVHNLTSAQKGKLIGAIDNYVKNGTTPEILIAQEFMEKDPLFNDAAAILKDFTVIYSGILNSTNYQELEESENRGYQIINLAKMCLGPKADALASLSLTCELGAKILEFFLFKYKGEGQHNLTMAVENISTEVRTEEQLMLLVIKMYLVGSPDGSIQPDYDKAFKTLIKMLNQPAIYGDPWVQTIALDAPEWQELFMMMPDEKPFSDLRDTYFNNQLTTEKKKTYLEGLTEGLKAAYPEEYAPEVNKSSYPEQANSVFQQAVAKDTIQVKIELLNAFAATAAGGRLVKPLQMGKINKATFAYQTHSVGQPKEVLEHIFGANGSIAPHWIGGTRVDRFESEFKAFLQRKAKDK